MAGFVRKSPFPRVAGGNLLQKESRMELKRDMGKTDLMDDMSDELEGQAREERSQRRIRNGFGGESQKKPLILAAAAAVILIVLLVLLFGGGDKNAAKELEAVKSKVEGIEKRLARIEPMEQKTSSLENQIKGLQGSVTRLEGQARALKDQLEKLSQAPAPKPQAPQAAAPQKKPSGPGEKKLHEVKRGETVFNIAKKYNMKADELRRLNNLSKNDAIQPGQKLIVVPGT
jgi:LysM repeat protein